MLIVASVTGAHIYQIGGHRTGIPRSGTRVGLRRASGRRALPARSSRG